jgi:hypothetical protein
VNSAFGLIHPTGGMELFLGFPLELRSYFDALGGPLVLQALSTGAGRSDHSDENAGHHD